MTTATYTVTGMTCEHCVNSVKQEVSKIDGVTDVDVELATGKVTVSSDQPVGDDAFRSAIDEAGFEVAPA